MNDGVVLEGTGWEAVSRWRGPTGRQGSWGPDPSKPGTRMDQWMMDLSKPGLFASENEPS